MSRNCWEILGVDSNADLAEIKKAYARLSREFHPEEHPEEYKELKEAYQRASRLAKVRRTAVVEDYEDYEEDEEELQEQAFPLNPQAYDEGLSNLWYRLEQQEAEKPLLSELQYDINTGEYLEETSEAHEKLLTRIAHSTKLNGCQRWYVSLFLRQAFEFHKERNTNPAYWRALCEKTQEWYKATRKNYSKCKKTVFFPVANVTEVLLEVLLQFQELESPVWDELEKYLFPRHEAARCNMLWSDLYEQYRLHRSYPKPGHYYAPFDRSAMKQAEKEIFSWVKYKPDIKKGFRAVWAFVVRLIIIAVGVVFWGFLLLLVLALIFG